MREITRESTVEGEGRNNIGGMGNNLEGRLSADIQDKKRRKRSSNAIRMRERERESESERGTY